MSNTAYCIPLKAISCFKEEAKKLKNLSSLSQSESLDLIAKKSGWDSWDQITQSNKNINTEYPIDQNTPNINDDLNKLLEKRNNLNPIYHLDNYIQTTFNDETRNMLSCLYLNYVSGFYSSMSILVIAASGLGKTHLLHAIGNTLVSADTNINVLYINIGEYKDALTMGIKNKEMQELKDNCRSVDVLLVDNIQLLSGNEKSQQEFIAIFKERLDHHKTVIMTSDVQTTNMLGFNEKLNVVPIVIKELNLESKIVIIKDKSLRLNIQIPSGVIEFLATYCNTDNICDLEDNLQRLIAEANILNEVITIDFAHKVF